MKKIIFAFLFLASCRTVTGPEPVSLAGTWVERSGANIGASIIFTESRSQCYMPPPFYGYTGLALSNDTIYVANFFALVRRDDSLIGSGTIFIRHNS